jgi:hypothetical protein
MPRYIKPLLIALSAAAMLSSPFISFAETPLTSPTGDPTWQKQMQELRQKLEQDTQQLQNDRKKVQQDRLMVEHDKQEMLKLKNQRKTQEAEK